MKIDKLIKLNDKINNNSFENKYETPKKILFGGSIVGNLFSIFFAYFLISPALYRAISINLVDGIIGNIITIIITIFLLSGFEILKRSLIGNLSWDLQKNKLNVMKGSIIGWLTISIGIIVLSFYFSVNGAQKFASTQFKKIEIIEDSIDVSVNDIEKKYDNKIEKYLIRLDTLYSINNRTRNKYNEFPINYISARRDLKKVIDDNNKVIDDIENKIDTLNHKMNLEINQLRDENQNIINKTIEDDADDKLLFIIISSIIELLIIIGVYITKFYDYNMAIIYHKKYKKQVEYKILIDYLFNKGDKSVGDIILGKTKLIDVVAEHSNVKSPKKFIDNFFTDMDGLGIFKVEGKRRRIQMSYSDAVEKINDFDDHVQILSKLG